MRKIVYAGFIRDIDNLWKALQKELEGWLPPKAAETVTEEVRRAFGGVHYLLTLACTGDSEEEAVRRIQLTLNDPGVVDAISRGLFEPVVFKKLEVQGKGEKSERA